MTSINGCKSVKILPKMTVDNLKLDIVNGDVHKKFGQILSICYQNIVRKQNVLTSIKGRNSVQILPKMIGNNLKLYLVNIYVQTNFGHVLYFILKILSGNQLFTE